MRRQDSSRRKEQDLRPFSLFSRSRKCLLNNSVAILTIWNIDDLRAKQLIEQEVGRRPSWFIASQHKNAFKIETNGCRCGLPAMVGLQCTARYQRLGTAFARLCR